MKKKLIHKPKIIYNNKYIFSEYINAGIYMDDSFELKYKKLAKFYHWLNEFRKFTPWTVNAKEKGKLCIIRLRI